MSEEKRRDDTWVLLLILLWAYDVQEGNPPNSAEELFEASRRKREIPVNNVTPGRPWCSPVKGRQFE